MWSGEWIKHLEGELQREKIKLTIKWKQKNKLQTNQTNETQKPFKQIGSRRQLKLVVETCRVANVCEVESG